MALRAKLVPRSKIETGSGDYRQVQVGRRCP